MAKRRRTPAPQLGFTFGQTFATAPGVLALPLRAARMMAVGPGFGIGLPSTWSR